MISVRTGVAVAMAGLGTLAAGAMSAVEQQGPKKEWGAPVSGLTYGALALGLGGTMAGVMTSLTGPGRSLRPMLGVLGAAVGGMLLGQHVLAPTLGAFGVRGKD